MMNWTEAQLSPLSSRINQRMERLWQIALKGMKDQKYLRAEKALLTILKLDKTNAAAYNRLGILYSRQKEYKDAIECFEIASSISPTASSLHNLGLIYFETEHFEKAAQAFESAINLEDDLAARHIAYAKVMEKLGNQAQLIESLEHAVSLEPSAQSYRLLANAYQENDEPEKAKELLKDIEQMTKKPEKPKRVTRPRRVI